MEQFKYKARKRDGAVVYGTVNAPNEAAVAAFIRKQDMYVAGIEASKKKGLFSGVLFEESINLYDISIFARQFATLLGAGVPLLTGLEILTQQSAKERLRTVLGQITTSVREGKALSAAMAEFPKVFPELMNNMVAAGEAGGILEIVMDRLAAQFEKDYRMNAKFKSAMIYPAIVLSVAAIVVAIIMMFVMPVFVGLFEQLKIELPFVTRVVIGISNFLGHYWYLVIAALIGLFLLYKWAGTKESFRLWRDGVYLKVPIFGDLYNKIIITRFARTFASLSRSGVPILNAMTIVSKATGSLQAERVLNQARGSLRRGRTLADPMEASGMFPPIVISLVNIGEETGALDTMLDKVADFYGAEVDDTIGRLQTIMDPILIVILGVIIGTLAVALLLPMFEIVTKVGSL